MQSFGFKPRPQTSPESSLSAYSDSDMMWIKQMAFDHQVLLLCLICISELLEINLINFREWFSRIVELHANTRLWAQLQNVRVVSYRERRFRLQWFTTSISLRAQSRRELEQHKTALYYRLGFKLKIVQIVLTWASIHQCSSFFNSNLEKDSYSLKANAALYRWLGFSPRRLSWCAATIVQGNWLPWWRLVQESRIMTKRNQVKLYLLRPDAWFVEKKLFFSAYFWLAKK